MKNVKEGMKERKKGWRKEMNEGKGQTGRKKERKG